MEYFVGLYINKNRDSDKFGKINNYLVNLYFSGRWRSFLLLYWFESRTKKEFLDKLFQYSNDSPNLVFKKLMSGRLLQAGWQTERSVKEYGIENAIKYSEEVRNYLYNIASKIHDSHI